MSIQIGDRVEAIDPYTTLVFGKVVGEYRGMEGVFHLILPDGYVRTLRKDSCVAAYVIKRCTLEDK